MSDADKWFFGFITLWVILCAGEPDLLDAVTDRVSGKYTCVEENKLERSAN